jgi:hypothetical protein
MAHGNSFEYIFRGTAAYAVRALKKEKEAAAQPPAAQ